MTRKDVHRQSPDFVGCVPDIRTCPPPVEIQRCVEVLRWLDALPITNLIQSRPPKQNSELVSVVVPMYNAREWIEMCLKGLLAQTHSNIEIFCVDDCSEDDTYERVVQQFGRDRRLCVVGLARNVGPFQISNWVAGSLARGSLLAWQDADNVSHPVRIEEQRSWMRSNGYKISGTCAHRFFLPEFKRLLPPTEALEAGGMLHDLVFYPSVERTEGPVDLERGIRRRKYVGWVKNDPSLPHRVGLKERNSARSYLSSNGVLSPHANQILERELFLEFGGFNGRTKLGEDTEFQLRLLRFYSIGNVPKVLYSRRLHKSSLTRHPATGLGSPARVQFRFDLGARQEEIRLELANGNLQRVRELSIESLYHADIEIEKLHAGFDVDVTGPSLSQRHR